MQPSFPHIFSFSELGRQYGFLSALINLHKSFLSFQQDIFSGFINRFFLPPFIFGRPQRVFGRPSLPEGAPSDCFGRPSLSFGAPSIGFGRPRNVFGRPQRDFGRPSLPEGAPSPGFGSPSRSEGEAFLSIYNQDRPLGTCCNLFSAPQHLFNLKK